MEQCPQKQKQGSWKQDPSSQKQQQSPHDGAKSSEIDECPRKQKGSSRYQEQVPENVNRISENKNGVSENDSTLRDSPCK